MFWSSRSSKSCRNLLLRGEPCRFIARTIAHDSRLTADNLRNTRLESGVAMRQGPLCLLLVMLSIGTCAHAEESPDAGSSAPLSQNVGSQITELQQRLKESERLRNELNKQVQSTDGERESAQLTRLRQENQRLKLQLKEAQASPVSRLLTEQQQWFVIGAAVALLALLCGIFASGRRRQRRQWLN
jgi:septal ring factor EnvC (AmiA/AmiB activator)